MGFPNLQCICNFRVVASNETTLVPEDVMWHEVATSAFLRKKDADT
jgi:hypothetical protein